MTEYVKNLEQNDRKILRDLGVKFGRYHIFLFKLIKPEAVSLRTLLWKNYHQKYFNLKPPKFGLNFIVNKRYNKEFLLLCGFECFDNFFVRIDILEKLFIKILNNTKDRKFKVNAEMMNLLGCTKENFYKLMVSMNYKKDKALNTYIFKGDTKRTNKFIKFDKKENPFKKLLSLNLK